MKNAHTDPVAPALAFFAQQNWQPFPFQRSAWEAYLAGQSGLVNAPTGSGKTYSLLLGPMLAHLAEPGAKAATGLRLLWVTPIRALAREIASAAGRALDAFGLPWQVGIRSGDTDSGERASQRRRPPQILVTTPESLHLLLASKGHAAYFAHLEAVVCDEWHELLGSKRGVQMELALTRLRALRPALRVWGISATIGNLEEALLVLMGTAERAAQARLIRADIAKRIALHSLLPDRAERLTWAGHLGKALLPQALGIIARHRSTLIFTNTRPQCEIWYQSLLEAEPELAGQIAMHHGSMDRTLRDWVENALHEGTLKAVVCTSSLDLGVDFRPVDAVLQIGSPKSVARLLQRAGRSGHQPGALSQLYFLPTHALELLEAAALREAAAEQRIEARRPQARCFDVLVQYLLTLAVADGFDPDALLGEVRGSHAFAALSGAEWDWLLRFISTGGGALQAYDEFRKAQQDEDGRYRVHDRRTAMRHRLSIGTIVGEAVLRVKFLGGAYLGHIEEGFAAQLKAGDVFWFAGRALSFVRIKDMDVLVRKSSATKGKIPSWQGSRLRLSLPLAEGLRQKMHELAEGRSQEAELRHLAPLAEWQARHSHLPREGELLVEYFKDREGYHLLFYPFEGRAVHEGLGALLAYRLSQAQPISFSIAANDYGFELLSAQPLDIAAHLAEGRLLSDSGLAEDIAGSINAVEMARRQFREIASIAGLVFKGFPQRQKGDRHLQASAQLFFEVFRDYEADNLLLQQAYEEVRQEQWQEGRLRAALQRLRAQRLRLARPAKATPLAFPIIVDRLRERLSSEDLSARIERMQLQLLRE